MKKNKTIRLFWISLFLILAGSLLANLIHTSNGSVQVRDVNFITEDGIKLHGILYIPNSATNENPAPGIVSSHGYNNTAEVQVMNAIELSRRGYVVFAIDAYWHGESGGTSINVDNNSIVPDMGAYSALQYIGELPFVDKENIGMVGHSMGSSVIQNATVRAFDNYDNDSSITIPKALMITANAFMTDPEITELKYNKYPINVGVIFGEFDEWSESMWGVKKGSELNTSPKAITGMGFSGAEYGSYYNAGIETPLSKEEAIEAAQNGSLRIINQLPLLHAEIHDSNRAVQLIIEYFDIALKQGTETLAYGNQIWHWKSAFTLIAMAGFFLAIIPIAFIFLKLPYFRAIVQQEPIAPTMYEDRKNKFRYWLIFIICLIPAPLLFYWAVGYPLDIASMGLKVPTVLSSNAFFQLPTVNGIVIINVLVGAFLLIAFILTYQFVMKKNGVQFEQLGIKISWRKLWRSALLAISTFIASYMLLVVVDYFFMTDFRYYVFSIKTLTTAKWSIFLKYLPFFVFFFVIFSLVLNSFTRIRGAKESTNIALMILASCGGYLALFLIDYAGLFTKGYKMFLYVPGTADVTTALAGMFVWNMLFILPIAAVYARLCFKKTGSIWLGGFLSALIVTLFAMSNAVISGGVLN